MLKSNEKNEPLRFADPSDRAEKKKKVKKTGIISFALSGAMVLGLLSATFLPKPETARAFESLPEIETIKASLTGSETNLRILEVVNNLDDAAFGYYIEGQEPKDLEKDVLAGKKSNAERTQAATNYYVGIANRGILAGTYIQNYSDYPLSFSKEYTEYYPWEDVPEDLVEQGFVHELDTPGETVIVSGQYSDEGSGNGAFALTGSSFDVVSSGGEYYQNLVTGTNGRGAVLVPASEIKDSDLSDYMFYKVALVPLYIGTDADKEAVFYQYADEESDEKFDFSGYDGKYVFRSTTSSYHGTIIDVSAKNPLDKEWIVSGDERELYFILDTLNLDDEKPLWGDDLLSDATKKAKVLAENSGWYGISMDVPFVKTASSSAYPYIVNFNIVPRGFVFKGKGNGQFNLNVTAVSGLPSNVEYASKKNSSTLTNPVTFEDPAPVSYDKVSYSIDVTNNNLFIKNVLDCWDETPELISSRAKSIQVDEVVGSELSSGINAEKGQNYTIADYDLIVFEPGNYTIPDGARSEILRVALENENDESCEKAMIVATDSPLASELMKKTYTKEEEEKTPADDLTVRATSFNNNDPGFSYGFADGNLFFFKPGTDDRKSIVTSDLEKAFDPICYANEGNAFYDVIDEIKFENVLRERAGSSDKLEETVNLGNVIRYILNFKKHRQQTTKSSVKILEIEPTDTSELRRSRVAYPDGTGKNNKDNAYPGATDDFFPFVYDWFNGTYTDNTITLSTMSTYEFVGKIDDITEEYDLVYIGSDISDFHVNDSWNNPTTKNYSFNVPSDFYSVGQTYYDTTTYSFDLPWQWTWKCYGHNKNITKGGWVGNVPKDMPVGDREYRYFLWKDTSKKTTAGTPVPVVYESDEKYSTYVENPPILYEAKYTTSYNDTSMNGLVYYNIGDINYSYEGSRAKGLVADDAEPIAVRYSGNDLTKKKLKELKDFANAGYPVIFADNLLKIDDNSAGLTVNNARVDVNSRMYDFIESVAKKANTYISTAASLSAYNSKLIRQLSLSKPMIDFSFDGGYSPSDYNETKGTNDHNAISNRTLSFTFRILNETDPTPLSTTYSLHLYIDRGSDGIFSEDDEVELSSSDLTGGSIYSLMGSMNSEDISHVYTLRRSLPDGVKGMVPWKLVVEKNGGGLHASEKGYAYTPVRVTNGNGSLSDQITINILQINTIEKKRTVNPDEDTHKEWGTKDTYSLEWQDKEKDGPFGKLFDILEDNGNGNYQLNIKTVTTEQVNAYYNDKHDDPSYYADPANAICDINSGAYDMLIIGFGDAYQELRDKTATAVTEFIDSGKAVLFSHDNTAPCNDRTKKNLAVGHGYYFNTIIRDRVGLDRYGITNDDDELSYTERDQWNSRTVNYKIGGSGFDADGNYIGAPGVLYNNNNYHGLNSYQREGIQEAGYDIAYKPSSNIEDKKIKMTDLHVHGFTDLFTDGLNKKRKEGIANENKYSGITSDIVGYPAYSTDVITMENEGQITKYPFNIENEAIKDSTFSNGRSSLVVSPTHLQYYQMNMMADDLIVWYCLGQSTSNAQKGVKDLYSYVPNDVANQYYIFTRGNVTYSGCGHSGVEDINRWKDPTEGEAKLFVNTMIAAYRAAYAAPEFKFVSTPEATDNFEIGTVCLPYETVGKVESNVAGVATASGVYEHDYDDLIGKINFRFDDANLDAGRTMGFSEFEILFDPDPYNTTVFEPDSQDHNQPCSFTHDTFRLTIDEGGHLVFHYKGDDGKDAKTTSKETVRFLDSDGNAVENGKFLTGNVYSLDIQSLVEIFTQYTSRSSGSINKMGNYKAPDTFSREFTINATPITYFANGTTKEADIPTTLKVTSLKMFDIG